MWQLIHKDLIRRWRSPLSTLVMIAFPLFMTGALGSIIGSGGGEQEFPRVKVLVENRDQGGFLSDAIVGSLNQEQAQQYLEIVIVGDEGRQMMEQGKASALVILPENFSRDILDNTPTAIEVVRNPSEGIKPEIIVQGTNLVATYLDQGARLLGDELGVVSTMIEAGEIPAAARVGVLASSIIENIVDVEKYLFPPLVTIGSVKESDETEEEGNSSSIYGYILIMTTVMALLFVASRSMGDVFDEKSSGMLRRQLTTPTGIGLIIGSKMVFGVLFGSVVLATLAIIGLLMQWIGTNVDALAALLLGISFSLAACGCLALITSLVRTEKQAGIFAWLIIMGMSALGGSMVPIEQLPDAMRAVAPFTVNYWAIDGFTKLVFENHGLPDILRNIGALLIFGIGTMIVSQILLVRRFREVTS